MHTLDEGIKSIGDVDAFFTYVRHVGATHHQVPGFKAENFWVSSVTFYVRFDDFNLLKNVRKDSIKLAYLLVMY